MPKVLIVDDQAIVRISLRNLLLEEDYTYVTGDATTGQQAIALCQAEPWDVVLLDISMPGQGGLSVLQTLRQLCPEIPVLMLSFFLERGHITQALEAGAAGYVAKEEISEEIIPAIKSAINGRQYLSPAAKGVLQKKDAQRIDPGM
jgi:DNA-binding NarL/FixJ family response regulator